MTGEQVACVRRQGNRWTSSGSNMASWQVDELTGEQVVCERRQGNRWTSSGSNRASWQGWRVDGWTSCVWQKTR